MALGVDRQITMCVGGKPGTMMDSCLVACLISSCQQTAPVSSSLIFVAVEASRPDDGSWMRSSPTFVM